LADRRFRFFVLASLEAGAKRGEEEGKKKRGEGGTDVIRVPGLSCPLVSAVHCREQEGKKKGKKKRESQYSSFFFTLSKLGRGEREERDGKDKLLFSISNE